MLQSLILNNEYCDEYAVVAFAVPVDVLEFSAVSQIITHAEERAVTFSNVKVSDAFFL